MNSEALVKRTTKIMFGDAGVSGTAQYMSQLVWILFLKVFDYKEEEWELEDNYVSVIPTPFRFRDWADVKKPDGSRDYKNRLTGDKLIDFVNIKLFPFLRGSEVEIEGKKYMFTSDDPKALIVREFMNESSNYMKDGVKLRQVIDEIADIDFDNVGEKHEFNEFYEKLLKELQNGGKATGEFYTPRAVTKFITDHVDPKIGERVADFACGTAGFLAEAVSHMQKQATTIEDNDTIQKSVYGIEWKQLPYMLATTNMFLHNVDNPNIVHGDGLAKNILDLSDDDMFDCILMNPPFGGVVSESSKANFPNDLVSGESADLFVARIIYCLKKNGRCGLVLPDGLLFQNDGSKLALKKKLLTECNLHTVIRLPESVFAPYTGISTNLLFFDKTGSTSEIWFYRMDMPKGRKHFNKTNPIRREDMLIIDEWWNNRVEIKDEKEDKSMQETWKAKRVSISEIMENDYSLDYCSFPNKEKVILSPDEVIINYQTEKKELESKLSVAISNLHRYIQGEKVVELINVESVGKRIIEIESAFSVDMRDALLQYAMQGKLTEQLETDSSVDELLGLINEKKDELIKSKQIKKEKKLPVINDEEIPFEIPNNWRWVRLRDICRKIVDGDHNPPSGVSEQTEYWMLSAQNINNSTITNLNNIRYLDKETFEYEDKRTEVRKGDILLTTVATLGRSCVYEYDYNICFQRSVTVVNTFINNYYLKYVFDNPYIQLFMINNATGTAQKGFYLNKVEKLVIPVPPLEEQQRIVEQLDKLLSVV